MSVLTAIFVGYAEWRQRLRKHLWRRGSRKLDNFLPRDFLAGAAVEVFGQYSTEVAIFDYLFTENSKNADEIVVTKLGKSKVLAMNQALLEDLDLREKRLILSHLQARNKSLRNSEAESLRKDISLFCRDKADVVSSSELETQMSQVAALGMIKLLRLRRHSQARDFICFVSTQIAATIILGDKEQI